MIWILSWSWPEAGLTIAHTIHTYMQQKYWAVQDTDYPKYVLYNCPLRWFDETWVVDELLVKNDLLEWLQKLKAMWADIIWIACNTLHIYNQDIIKSLPDVHFVSIINSVIQRCLTEKIKKVLVLSSSTTKEIWLYTKNLEKNNIEAISVNNKEQEILDNVIEAVMAWHESQKENNELNNIIEKYMTQEIEWVILWCTELPIAMKINTSWCKIINSNIILEKSKSL